MEVMMDFLEDEGVGGGDGNPHRSIAMRNQEEHLFITNFVHAP